MDAKTKEQDLVTVKIPKDLRQKLKIRAAQEGVTIQKLLVDLLEKGLKA